VPRPKIGSMWLAVSVAGSLRETGAAQLSALLLASGCARAGDSGPCAEDARICGRAGSGGCEIQAAKARGGTTGVIDSPSSTDWVNTLRDAITRTSGTLGIELVILGRAVGNSRTRDNLSLVSTATSGADLAELTPAASSMSIAVVVGELETLAREFCVLTLTSLGGDSDFSSEAIEIPVPRGDSGLDVSIAGATSALVGVDGTSAVDLFVDLFDFLSAPSLCGTGGGGGADAGASVAAGTLVRDAGAGCIAEDTQERDGNFCTDLRF
jgi:hypothetical protein